MTDFLPETNPTKVCRKCGERRGIPNEFHVDKVKSDGFRGVCKQCEATRCRERYLSNPKKVKEASNQYAKDHPDRIRKTKKKYRAKNHSRLRGYHLKKMYGITHSDFEEMSRAQGFLCALCHRPPSSNSKSRQDRRLQVDHVHVDGFTGLSPTEKRKYIRGLLCGPCNRALGLIKDSISVLTRSVEYIPTRFWP